MKQECLIRLKEGHEPFPPSFPDSGPNFTGHRSCVGGGQGAAVYVLNEACLSMPIQRLQPQEVFRAGRRMEGLMVDCRTLGNTTLPGLVL